MIFGVWPVIIGAIVDLFGTGHYIINTVRGITRPNRMTWLMWSIAPLIGAVAALTDGASWATLPVFMAGLIPIAVFAASFINRHAYWKLEPFDYVCGVLSALALILWWLTDNANIAIVFAIGSDFTAGIPTLIKSWKQPETETSSIYIVGVFSNVTSFFVITRWTFAAYAFPLYLMLMNVALAYLIVKKKRVL